MVTKPFPTSNWPFFFAPPIPTSLRRFAFETHGKTRAIGDMTSDITSFAIGDTKWFATGEGSTHLAQRFQNRLWGRRGEDKHCQKWLIVMQKNNYKSCNPDDYDGIVQWLWEEKSNPKNMFFSTEPSLFIVPWGDTPILSEGHKFVYVCSYGDI